MSRWGLRPNGRGGWAHQGDVEASKRFSLAARHRFFGQAPKKWGRMAGKGNDPHPTYRRTRTKPPTSTSPAPSRAKMSKDNRGSSAHANGGATGVKKRFSLAARHRFFGQAQKKWGRMAGQANDPLPTYRRTRISQKKARRGTLVEGPPFHIETKNITFTRASRRGSGQFAGGLQHLGHLRAG